MIILPENDENERLPFDLLKTLDGKTNEGIKFSEQQFKSTDCIVVSVRTEYYESASLAQNEWQKRLKDAANVMERSPIQDATGQETGQRAVAMFAPDPSYEYQPQAVVIWTKGPELHFIQAPSLRHVREFEKRYYQASR